MSSRMAKGIAMGIYQNSDINQNFGFVFNDFYATASPWVRFWVDWTQLAPNPPGPGPTYVDPATDPSPCPGGGLVKDYVSALDQQIRLAKSKGFGVIVTFAYFPPWVNGVTDQFPNYKVHPPQDLSYGGAWSVYLQYCILRWSSANPGNAGAYYDIFEVCNEPNKYLKFDGDQTPLYFFAGRQMVTARRIQLSLRPSGVYPVLAGPGTLDLANQDSGNDAVGVRPFTLNLIRYLNSQGFDEDQYFAWTQHDYVDMKNQSTTLAQAVRTTLSENGWNGWPFADPARVVVLHTEGGVKWAEVGGETQQANMLANYYKNLAHNDGTGLGIFLVMNYLDVGPLNQPEHDTGLREYGTYRQRPAFGAWASCPTP